MSWTYSGDPSANDKDFIRFLLMDTLSTDQLLSDEEIAALILTYTNVYLAAAWGARAIALKFARMADSQTASKIKREYKNRVSMYDSLFDDLSSKANTGQPKYTASEPIFVIGAMDDD